MNKSNFIRLLTISILIILFSVYLIYSKYNTVPKNYSNQTITWKTYTDSKNGYSINYPSSWDIEKATNDTYTSIKSSDLELNPVPSVIEGYMVTVGPKGSGYFVGGDVPASDFCKKDIMFKIMSCSEIKMGEIKGIKKAYSNYPYIDVAILRDNKIVFVIRFEYKSSLLNSSQNFEIFDQIVSSFKFIK